MSHNLLTKWLAPRQSQKRRERSGRRAASSRSYRPRLERLENRIVPTIVTPFTVRYTINTTGDTVVLGNTLETASTVGNPGRTQQDVINAQNGTGSFINNTDWTMVYVNVVTTTPGFFNSSTAALNLPTGASVLFAGLYWLGNSSSALRTQVRFAIPATRSNYTTINGALIGDTSSVTPRRPRLAPTMRASPTSRPWCRRPATATKPMPTSRSASC